MTLRCFGAFAQGCGVSGSGGRSSELFNVAISGLNSSDGRVKLGSFCALSDSNGPVGRTKIERDEGRGSKGASVDYSMGRLAGGSDAELGVHSCNLNSFSADAALPH